MAENQSGPCSRGVDAFRAASQAASDADLLVRVLGGTFLPRTINADPVELRGDIQGITRNIAEALCRCRWTNGQSELLCRCYKDPQSLPTVGSDHYNSGHEAAREEASHLLWELWIAVKPADFPRLMGVNHSELGAAVLDVHPFVEVRSLPRTSVESMVRRIATIEAARLDIKVKWERATVAQMMETAEVCHSYAFRHGLLKVEADRVAADLRSGVPLDADNLFQALDGYADPTKWLFENVVRDARKARSDSARNRVASRIELLGDRLDRGASLGNVTTSLTKVDTFILEALRREGVEMVQTELEVATGQSRRTLSPRIQGLKERGFVATPQGKKARGLVITDAGRNAVERLPVELPDDALANPNH